MRYVLMSLSAVVCSMNIVAGQAEVKTAMQTFITGLDSIRVKLKIPGMAAAVMKGDSILFEKGFGYADLQNHKKAAANTSFRIASITKTFTSTLIMQQVERGKLDLESPILIYGLDFGNPHITIRNLLTHTSEGEPGTHYQYNGFRFGQLGAVLEKAVGLPFYQLLMEQIVKPLNMSSTAPGNSPDHYLVYTQQNKDMPVSYTHLTLPTSDLV